MKILYLNHYAGSPKYGMEFRPYYLAREWCKAGHEVVVIAASYSHLRYQNPTVSSFYQHEIIDGVRYIWCRTPAYSGNGLGRVINIFTFLWRVVRLGWRYLHQWQPNVIIASSTYPLDTLPAVWMARRCQARVVYEVHDLWPLTPIEVGGMPSWHPFIRLLQWAEDFGYRHADTVISMLPCAKQHMMQHGMKPEKYCVIPNGIDVGEWESSTLYTLPDAHAQVLENLKKRQHFLVGYAGGLGLANALDTLIASAERLNDVPVAFVLLGEGPEKADLMNRVRQRRLTNVYFLPAVSKSVVPAFLAHMDVMYLGWKKLKIYRFGINPNKLFDYLMAGKPVVHAVEAGNDIVQAARAGLSVPPEDPEALAGAIRTLLAMPAAERVAMGTSGKTYVLANHNYQHLAQMFLETCQA